MSENKIEPTTLPGFMELLPREQLVFNSMLKKIRKGFELFGFLPLDTVIMERAEILTAKGGGETDRQIYQFKKGDTDVALRFDLTVPLARFVSQNYHKLTFPFRRYQIGKVYRGEKPQRGRFREFYQCDIDIIGDEVLEVVNDAEIPAVIYFIFKDLDLGKFKIRINNRKILTGFIRELKLSKNSKEVMRAIDKLEKTGEKEFVESLKKIGLDEKQIDKLKNYINIKGDYKKVINSLNNLNVEDKTFKEGVNELEEVSEYIKSQEIPQTHWNLDLQIARGLDYYTGTVYETIIEDHPDLGSVCSGGRYDNLAEYYTDRKLPGVGVSIGLTRLFYLLNENNLIEKKSATPTRFLIVPIDVSLDTCFSLATKVRKEEVPTEVYTQKSGMREMLTYANDMGIPYVGLIGKDELENNEVAVKNMATGKQTAVKRDKVPEYLKDKNILN